MKFHSVIHQVIILTFSSILIGGCTYDVSKYYSEVCKTDFNGFPDIPGWSFTTVPVDPSIEDYQIRQIYFFEDKKGILVTYENIWLTENEGLSWKKVFTNPFMSVYDISFSDPLHGFIFTWMRYDKYVLKTNDGGRTWTKWLQPKDDYIKNFSFVDSLKGVASILHDDVQDSLEHTFIAKTSDGGLNWEEIEGLSTNKYSANSFIRMLANGFGYVLGDDGEIHLTSDAGESWTTIATGANIDFIQFLDPQTGFYSDYSRLYMTLDGGNTWTDISQGSPVWFHFFSPSDGITLQTLAYDFDTGEFEEYYECNAFLTLSPASTDWSEGNTSINFHLHDENFINKNLGYGITYSNGTKIVKLFR